MKNLNILLLIIGLLIAKLQIIFGDGCIGVVQAMFSFFLIVIYLVILLVINIRSVYSYFKKEEKYNFTSLLITALSIVLFFLAHFINNHESKTILCAYADRDYGPGGFLYLKQNKKFKIVIQHTEYACFFKGKYKIQNDTLYLEKDELQTKTQYVFTNKYIIDETQKKMYPLNLPEQFQNSSHWLRIRYKL